MTKLFVGGLPFDTTNQSLTEMFSIFGDVISAFIVVDKVTHKSKGFGFVEMENDDDASKAIDTLHDSMIGTRKITVNIARPREERPINQF